MSDPTTLPPRPAWESDFPQERLETQHVTRREFAKFLVVVSGGMTVASGAVALNGDLAPHASFEPGGATICRLAELPVGGTKAFVVPGTALPGILVRPDADTVRAFEQKCTHLSCAVFYSPEKDHIVCPCHNGGFDAHTGQVLYGPPPRPLHQFTVEIRGDDVVLTGNVERPVRSHGSAAPESRPATFAFPACDADRA